jgi:hypothetical protein
MDYNKQFQTKFYSLNKIRIVRRPLATGKFLCFGNLLLYSLDNLEKTVIKQN